jgi:RNA polymerase sigma-70 factor (ECF subfamily)
LARPLGAPISEFELLSDEQLVEMFKMGNEKAFDDLYERYRLKLYFFIYRVVGEREQALDLVQDAFLSAYGALPRWQPKAKFSTWLYTIAVNKVRTHLRLAHRRQLEKPLESEGSIFGSSIEMQLPSQSPEPDAAYDKDRLVEAFVSGIKALPEQQRKVFVLRHQNALKISEIAEVLGLKEGSIKAHLFKAVANLMNHFKKLGIDFTIEPQGVKDE